MYNGKAQFSLIVIAPPELEAESDRIWGLHADWIARTHHREGEKALLQYNVAKSTDEDGRIRYALTEVYETMAGIEDHFAQYQNGWEAREAWDEWIAKCEMTPGGQSTVVHSLW